MDQTKSLVRTTVISLQRACHVGDCSMLFVFDEQCSSCCWHGGFCTCRWDYQFLQCPVALPKVSSSVIYTYIYTIICFGLRVQRVYDLLYSSFSYNVTVVVPENDCSCHLFLAGLCGTSHAGIFFVLFFSSTCSILVLSTSLINYNFFVRFIGLFSFECLEASITAEIALNHF